MKNLSKLNIASILLSILFTFFFVVYFVYSTTIGEDISTTNLTITNNLSVGNNATTTGNLNVLGNFSLEGIATMLSNLSISGNTSISQNLSVSGTSTLSTTTISKLNNVIIVDGIHYPKTSTGIQNAINALPEEGGKVFLPEGTYQVSSTILIPSNVTLEGAHTSSTILYLADNSHCNVIQNQDTTNGNTNITLRNFKIDGNDAGNDGTDLSGINFNNITNSKIENVWVYDVEDYGIFSDNSSDIFITGCIFESNNRGNFLGSNYAYRHIIANNYFLSNSYGIFFAWQTDYHLIIGNVFKDNGISVYLFSSTDYNVVIGNEFYGETSAGVYIRNSSNNIISNNAFYNSGTAEESKGSIWVRGVDGSPSHNLITSNQIYHSNGYAGINIENSNCENNYISNNYISGNWNAGEIRDLGTNTIYTNQLLNNNLLFTFPTSTSKFIIGATSSSEKFLLQIEPNVDITLGQGSNSTSTTFITLRDSNSTLWYIYPDTSGNLVVTTTKP